MNPSMGTRTKLPVSYGPERGQGTTRAWALLVQALSFLVRDETTAWSLKAGVGVHSLDRMFQGRNIRAPMDASRRTSMCSFAKYRSS